MLGPEDRLGGAQMGVLGLEVASLCDSGLYLQLDERICEEVCFDWKVSPQDSPHLPVFLWHIREEVPVRIWGFSEASICRSPLWL